MSNTKTYEYFEHLRVLENVHFKIDNVNSFNIIAKLTGAPNTNDFIANYTFTIFNGWIDTRPIIDIQFWYTPTRKHEVYYYDISILTALVPIKELTEEQIKSLIYICACTLNSKSRP